MKRTRIKICGITRVEDALAAERAGCDAIGVVLWPESPRYVASDTAAAIGRAVSPLVTRIGVLVAPTVDDVLRLSAAFRLDAVQLCGALPEGPWETLSRQVRLIRVIGATDGVPLQWEPVPGVNDYLVDTHDESRHGGTGRTFDWSLLHDGKSKDRLWLAGGLSPANVGTAVETVRPFAVDVSSGVEVSPGVKSRELIEDFIRAVRKADARGK